ncbi:hypothetical protein KKA33_01155 [Patescibacteria group bacterium]|nr:hypothetical protein [Patescibacteria group bacterium]
MTGITKQSLSRFRPSLEEVQTLLRIQHRYEKSAEAVSQEYADVTQRLKSFSVLAEKARQRLLVLGLQEEAEQDED